MKLIIVVVFLQLALAYAYVDYRVDIKTGTVSNAGTDATVSIQLNFPQLNSAIFQLLSPGRDSFENGQTDSFTVRSSDYVDLIGILISQDDTGADAGWFLDSVVVTNTRSNKSWRFIYKDWLARDNQLSVLLFPVADYTVQTWTSNDKDAGTDANVYISIFNGIRTTGKLNLDNPNVNDFERSTLDKFVVTARDVGVVTQIIIEQDNSGFGAGWLFDKITVTNGNSGQTWTFKNTLATWLSKPVLSLALIPN